MSFEISKNYINQRCGLHLKEDQVERNNKKGIVSISRDGSESFTKCSNHEHITREKYDEVIPQIINEFIIAGFSKTQEFFKKNIDVKNKYSHLKKDRVDINHITAQKTTNSNKIIKHYMSHLDEVKDHQGNSIQTLWTKENLIKAFKSLDKPNRTVNSQFSEIKKALKFSPVTVYSPIMTKTLIQKLDCKNIFDPCIGWGGRMIGTTCLGDDYHYTGCEPSTETYNGLKKMVSDLSLENQVTLYNKPVEEVLDTIGNVTYDMCLTSPPYYDLEIYSDEETQSINRYSTYEIWIQSFIKPIIDYVCSHITKYSCWSVKNFQTDKKYNLLNDVMKLHAENGWKIVDHYSIKKSVKNGTTDGDITYVFSK